jgi:hypothetical protein
MAFENWDWDEFMGGIADTGISGFRAGQEMRNAGQAARVKRLNDMELNPDPYIAEYDRRQRAREGPLSVSSPVETTPTSFGIGGGEQMFGGEPRYGLYGEPVAEAPGVELAPAGPLDVDLGAAREAVYRQRAGDMYAQSEKAKKFLEGISDEELAITKSRSERKKAEVIAGDLKKSAAEYYTQNRAVERSADVVKQLQARLSQTDDPDRIDQLERQIETEFKKGRDAEVLLNRAVADLTNLGLDDKDLALLTTPGQYGPNVDVLIQKITGQRKTRAPGARAR